MSYTNKYYPDYEKIYPDVKLTPAVLAVLRQSDRQMRRFEEELKAEHFEFDNEKRIARFMHGREDSYERLLEEGHLQFGSEDIDVESLVLRRESIRCLQRAMQLLTQADMELLQAIYYQGMTERQFAKKKSIHYMTIHKCSPKQITVSTRSVCGFTKWSSGWTATFLSEYQTRILSI